MKKKGLLFVLVAVASCGGQTSSTASPHRVGGRVELVTFENEPGRFESFGWAAFWDIASEPAVDEQSFGPCVVRTMRIPTGGDVTSLAVGDVRLSGGPADGQVIRWSDEQHAYGELQTSSLLFPPGTLVSVAADGGSKLGAFTASVEAPPQIRIVAPLLGPPRDIEQLPSVRIDESADLALRWKGSTPAHDVLLTLDLASADSVRFATMTCTYRGGDTSGSVPREALALVDRATSPRSGLASSITMSSAAHTDVVENGSTISVSVRNRGVQAAQPFDAEAVLE